MEQEDREQIEWLQRQIEVLVDFLGAARLRVLALQSILELNGMVAQGAVEAKMQAIREHMTLEMNYAPEFEEFRRLKELARDARKRRDDQQRKK